MATARGAPGHSGRAPRMTMHDATTKQRRAALRRHLGIFLLGDRYAWPRIHALNRDRVANPDLIFPGQEIRIPGT